MKTEHFAVKLTPEEKKALDFVSSRSRTTMSKLMYPLIRKEIERMLGITLIYTLGYMHRDDMDIMKRTLLSHKETNMLSPLPRSIEIFIDIILKSENWSRYYNIMGDALPAEAPDADVLMMLISDELPDIYRDVGSTYLSTNPRFQGIDLDLIRGKLFEILIRTLTFHLSKKPYSQTKQIFNMKRHEIHSFIRSLESQFNNIVSKAPIEALTVETKPGESDRQDQQITEHSVAKDVIHSKKRTAIKKEGHSKSSKGRKSRKKN